MDGVLSKLAFIVFLLVEVHTYVRGRVIVGHREEGYKMESVSADVAVVDR